MHHVLRARSTVCIHTCTGYVLSREVLDLCNFFWLAVPSSSSDPPIHILFVIMPAKVILIADPDGPNPVNPLGASTRTALAGSLRAALNDPSVTSIVLAGRGSNFSAGADIREFGRPSSISSGGGNGGTCPPVPSLVELCQMYESSPKPVVAAISGACLGGGLELALACHYRVCPGPATPGAGAARTKLGLPEVNLGLIPGAGGTQRLPRLCGVAYAVRAITSGKPAGPAGALRVGLIDGVAGAGTAPSSSESLLDCAVRWAVYAEAMPPAGRMVSRRAVRGSPRELNALCDKAAKKIPRPEKGGEAGHAAVRAIRASFGSTFEGGMATEAKLFWDLLLESGQGRARRHAFFSERASTSSPATSGAARSSARELVANPAQTAVGVVGAGTMGSGIALSFLRAGYSPVILVDNNTKGLERGVGLIHGLIKTDAAKGRLKPQAAMAMAASLSSSTDMSALGACSLIVEAVFENLEVKKAIFGQLDGIAPPKAYLSTNTSTLDVDAIASALSPERRGRCVGMHFFSPAHVMKLVEIVRSSSTSDETVAAISSVTKKINKVGVTVGNCDGFVGNRMLIPYTSEMLFVVEAGGATVAQVDAALTRFGMAVGPFVMSDIAGNDIGYSIRRERGVATDPETGRPGPNRKEGMRYTDLGDDLVVKLGRIGQKAGKGWYTYDKRFAKGRWPLPSSEVNAFVANYAAKSSSPDKGCRLNGDEIVERLLYPLVNEGFKILEEEIARDPADIDVIYLYGYGFPAYRGGPMFWADNEVGLPKLLGRLEQFHSKYPGSDYFEPSQLLRKCVSLGIGVQEYYRVGRHKSESGRSKL